MLLYERISFILNGLEGIKIGQEHLLVRDLPNGHEVAQDSRVLQYFECALADDLIVSRWHPITPVKHYYVYDVEDGQG